MNVITITLPKMSLSWRWNRFRARVASRMVRARRAWRYAAGTMTEDDAQWITMDCRHVSGWHPLTSLCNASVLEYALEVYEDHPELKRLVGEACDCVYSKWEDYSDATSAASEWAMEKVAEYAAMDGIELVKREGWEE